MAQPSEGRAKRVEHSRTYSHGRGGAGNINAKPTATLTTPADLVTPTLKSSTYTTGRGGTGTLYTLLPRPASRLY